MKKLLEAIKKLKDFLKTVRTPARRQLVNGIIQDLNKCKPDQREWFLGTPKEDGLYFCYNFEDSVFDAIEIYADEENPNNKCVIQLVDAPYNLLHELAFDHCIWHGPIDRKNSDSMNVTIGQYHKEQERLSKKLHFHAPDSYKKDACWIFIVKKIHLPKMFLPL